MGAVIHSAPLVLPVSEPPIHDGAMAVRGDRVLLVGARRQVRRAYPRASEVRWAGTVVPGLVNAHTHLQYTRMAEVGRRAYGTFEEWSGAFDAVYFGMGGGPPAQAGDRRPSGPAVSVPRLDWAASALDGARECLRHGVTAVADVVTDIEAVPALAETGLRGVSYLEVLGDTDEEWNADGRDRLITAIREVDHAGPIGISPHAPYTLDTGVLEDLAILARTFGLRQHIHLAESAHEREYTVSGTGPLAKMVRDLGFDFTILREGGSGLGPVRFLDALGALGPHCHVAHGVHLDSGERRLLRRRGTSVALCPRSNHTIGRGGPDVAALLADGNPICVGTDSLASAPSLDLLEDVRAVKALAVRQGFRGGDLDARLLEAATLGGARAMGLATGPGRIGSLGAGSRADFAVFDAATDVPYSDLVAEGRCVATVLGGRVAWSRDHEGAASAGRSATSDPLKSVNT